MARNEEKQLGRLNRLWLQQQHEEQAKKTPARPGLGSLHTAAEVKKWLPSIKRDIDFYLKQSQVACYPERQIEEFSLKIEQLTKEYKAYVRKLRELEPGLTAVPWTDRAYNRKRRLQDDQGNGEDNESEPDSTTSKTSRDSVGEEVHLLLSTPVLEKDDDYKVMYGHEEPAQIMYNSDPDREDAPLNFNFSNKPLRSSETGDLYDQKERPSVKHTVSDASELHVVTCNCPSGNPMSQASDLSDGDLDIHYNRRVNSSANEDRGIRSHCTCNSVNEQVATTAQKTSCFDKSELEPIAGHSTVPTQNECGKCVLQGQLKTESDLSLVKKKNEINTPDEPETLSETELTGKKTSEDLETTSVEKTLTLNLPYSDSSDEEV